MRIRHNQIRLRFGLVSYLLRLCLRCAVLPFGFLTSSLIPLIRVRMHLANRAGYISRRTFICEDDAIFAAVVTAWLPCLRKQLCLYRVVAKNNGPFLVLVRIPGVPGTLGCLLVDCFPFAHRDASWRNGYDLFCWALATIRCLAR